jgi:dUTP pyrophosphatase
VTGFRPVAGAPADLPLPSRKTRESAGYDLAVARRTTLPAGQVTLVPTGVKVYLPEGTFLAVVLRSSQCLRGLVLANGLGVVDRDYVDNAGNEGEILLPVWNTTGEEIALEPGERLGQGIVLRYETFGDVPLAERQGGFGSTGPCILPHTLAARGCTACAGRSSPTVRSSTSTTVTAWALWARPTWRWTRKVAPSGRSSCGRGAASSMGAGSSSSLGTPCGASDPK